MIPRLLEQLDRARQEFSWNELCYGLVPCATVLRWRARSQAGEPLLQKAGPKKPEPLDAQAVQKQIAQLDHRPTADRWDQCPLRAISRRPFPGAVSRSSWPKNGTTKPTI